MCFFLLRDKQNLEIIYCQLDTSLAVCITGGAYENAMQYFAMMMAAKQTARKTKVSGGRSRKFRQRWPKKFCASYPPIPKAGDAADFFQKEKKAESAASMYSPPLNSALVSDWGYKFS